MRGSIIKRGKTYSIVVELPKDPATGERRRQWYSGFKTKREAEKELAIRITEVEKGTYSELSKLPFSEYLQRWFAVHKNNLAPSTFRRYEGIINDKLIPSLGRVKLKDLALWHIQEFVSNEQNNGRKDNKKSVTRGLAPATVAYEYRVLHKALKQALDWEIITKNPADGVKLPRSQSEQVEVLLEEEVKRLLGHIKPLYLYIPVYLAVFTGMRLGEILGLRWQDVDLENMVIRVVQSSCQAKVGEPQFKKPKTKSSRRTIDISEVVVTILREHREEQERWKSEAKEMWQDYKLVCCHQDGNPINPPNLSSYFRSITARLGLGVTFHGLRHTHASLLFKAGVPSKVVSDRLGHSSIAITMDIYSHVMPGMQKEAANKLQDMLKED